MPDEQENTQPDHEAPPPVSLILEATMRPLLAAYVEIGKLPLPRRTFECIGPVDTIPVATGRYAYFVVRGQRRGGKVEHHGVRCQIRQAVGLQVGDVVECVGYLYRPDPQREPVRFDSNGHAFLVRRVIDGDSLLARKDNWWLWCNAALLVDSDLGSGVK